jgi:hypothetical protein
MTSVLDRRTPSAGETDTDTAKEVKRYQLVLPQSLYDRVHAAAEEREVTVVQLLRAFIKLGLVVLEAENDPHGELILRTEHGEKQLVLV